LLPVPFGGPLLAAAHVVCLLDLQVFKFWLLSAQASKLSSIIPKSSSLPRKQLVLSSGIPNLLKSTLSARPRHLRRVDGKAPAKCRPRYDWTSIRAPIKVSSLPWLPPSSLSDLCPYKAPSQDLTLCAATYPTPTVDLQSKLFGTMKRSSAFNQDPPTSSEDNSHALQMHYHSEYYDKPTYHNSIPIPFNP
jgi:hypothetical protein